MNKKTALYIRVSTDAQFEEGYSVDAQKEKLRQFCALKDIDDYEFYIDGGWSGSNIERPEMKRMIEDITHGKISAVIVYKLDRLSRSQKDTVYLLEDVFIPNGCNFISLNENFDTTTPYGKAMIGILSVFAQLERENIRERTRMGMYERVKEGLWPGGGKIPFGYDYDSAKNTLVPNEHAKEVRQIYELYLQGYSTSRLAAMFPVSGDKQISDILSRVTYLGKISFRGEITDGKHKALIDEKTWERVREERLRRSKNSAFSSEYLLTGLIFCGKCGARMRYQRWGKDSVKIYCYSQQTTKKSMIRDKDCDNARADAFETEKTVLDDLFSRCELITANDNGSGAPISVIDVLREKYAALSSKLKKLYNLYAEAPDELLLETIAENKKELSRISESMDNEQKLEALNEKAREDRESIKNLRGSWEHMTVKEKRRALRLCIGRIEITNSVIDIKYNF